MKYVILVLVSMVCLQVHAEEKTCTLKGIECTSCAGKVKDLICNPNYSTCEVRITDKSKKVGQVHLITKDNMAKIDDKAIGEAIKETTYTVEKCVMGGPTKKST